MTARNPGRDAEIVKLRAQKISYADIARRYGISDARARQIVKAAEAHPSQAPVPEPSEP